MKKSILFMLPVLTLLFASGCNEKTEEKITVSFTQAEYTAYEDETFTVEVKTNSKKALKYSVENSDIASITNKGLVICKEPGDTKLTVSVEGVSSSSLLHIKEATSSQFGIEVESETFKLSLKNQESKKITPRFYKIEGEKIYDDTKTFTFESEDESIFTVSSDGVVSALKQGTANLLISTSGASKEVAIDVYNEFISTPIEWINMLSTHQMTDGEGETGPYTSFECFNYRALVTENLDFSNTPYTCEDSLNSSKGYYPSLQRSQYFGFAGEVNGDLHTLSNINFAEVKYIDGKGNQGIQSLFGHLRGAYIHDIEFTNVQFNQPNCAALAFTDRCGTPSYSYNNGNKHITKVERVYIEASTKQCMTGLFYEYCGSTITDVVLKLKYTGTDPLTNSTSLFTRHLYNWDNGSANKIILFTEDNEIVNTFKDNSNQTNPLNMDTLLNSESKIEAAYFANQHFSPSIWNISIDDLPTLKK